MKRISLVLISMLLLGISGKAQDQREPTRVTVLPIENLSGNSNPNTTAFTGMLLSRLSREEKLFGQLAKPDNPTLSVGREVALSLAKKQGASLLLLGKITEATTRQGNSGLPIPPLGRVNSHSTTAEVKVEMEVATVATGMTLQLVQAEARKTVRSNQTWVNSRVGSIHISGNTPNTSPMGLAMNECADKLVRRLLEVISE